MVKDGSILDKYQAEMIFSRKCAFRERIVPPNGCTYHIADGIGEFELSEVGMRPTERQEHNKLCTEHRSYRQMCKRFTWDIYAYQTLDTQKSHSWPLSRIK